MKRRKGPRAPRLARILLAQFLPRHQLNPIIGDLEESFGYRVKKSGAIHARIWYWHEAISLSLGFWRENWNQDNGLSLSWSDVRTSFAHCSHDLRFALRMAHKSPWMAAASVVALGAGMAVAISSFSLLWDAYFAELPFEEADRIVAIRDVGLNDPDDLPPRLAVLQEWQRTQTSFDVMAASYRRERDVSDGEGGLARYPVSTITASGFDVAGVGPHLGRVLLETDEEVGAPPVTVVSFRLWQGLLGSDPNVLGRKIEIDGQLREIVGVMPEGFRFPVSEDIWIPFNIDPEIYKGVEPRWVRVFGRLSENAGIERAAAELDAIRARYASTFPGDEDLQDRRTTVLPFVQGETEPGTYIVFLGMFGFVVMVLIIACASVANLLLARAASRTGEFAIRAAIGANRLRLLLQMFLEAGLLTGAAGLLGITVASLGLDWFESMLQVESTPFWVHFGLNPAAAVFALIAAFGAALIAGILPALKATRLSLNEVLKDEQGNASRVRFGTVSGILTIVEVTLSVALLAAAGLTARSLLIVGDLELELPVDQVLVTELRLADETSIDEAGNLIVPPGAIPPSQWGSFQEAIRSDIEHLPGVRRAMFLTSLPGTQHRQARVAFPHEETGSGGAPRLPYSRISPEFFDIFDSGLLGGRNFGAVDSLESERVAIVNSSFVKGFLGSVNPLGTTFEINPGSPSSFQVRIVGVSPDLRMNPGGESQAGFYLPFSQARINTFTLAIRAEGDPQALSGSIRSAIQGIDSRIDVAVFETNAERAARMGVVFQLMSLMFGALGGTAIFLAVSGLYAVMAVSVAGRTREVGIRLALGAHSASILGVVLRRGLWQVTMGIILGSVLGKLLMGLLQFFPAGMASGGNLLLAIASSAMLLVGLLACLVPGARALRVRPVEALRHA